MTAARPTIIHSPGLAGLRFDGTDVASFLHNQLSTDVEAMKAGDCGWTTYNSPKGRVLASPLLWRRGETEFIAYVPAEIAEALRKRLAMYVLRARVAVTLRTGRYLAGVFGPTPVPAPVPGHGTVEGDTDIVALPDGRLLLDGERPAQIAGDDADPSHWDWLGIRAGVPQITQATQDLFVPQTANFDLVGGIHFRKGCYPGQEIVARMQYLGRLKERTHGFHVDADPPAAGSHISAGEDNVGTVVNAAPSPEGGSDLLAVVNLAAFEAGGLRLADGAALTPFELPYEVPAPASPNRVKL